MQPSTQYGHIKNICVIGHGSIGRGTVPLIMRHFTFDKMTIIDPSPVDLPDEHEKVVFLRERLIPGNFQDVLDKVFGSNSGFCVNLSVGTSSQEIMLYCQRKGLFYIDTVKEEWQGHYSNQEVSLQEKSNYGLRNTLLNEIRKHNLKTTAVSCCGANPGMVSWFVKQALLNLVKDMGIELPELPKTRQEWGELMMKLGVKGIHIAERDTQVSSKKRPEGQFWNTWSVDGFISEGYYQPAELGWGTHQKWMPKNAKQFNFGPKCSIYMTKPGMSVQVKSWCPTMGSQYGFLVTHDESISIADYYTVKKEGKIAYRPTCHYAYHPCQDAVISSMEAIGSGKIPDKWHIIEKQIQSGFDELGVLLYGHSKNAYWFGSQLDIKEARRRGPYQSATSLQVCSAVIAGMAWALQNPEAGLVECDEMDFKRCLEIQMPYIEPVQGYYTDWTPLSNRSSQLVDDELDLQDPWQFKNVLINK